MITKTKEILVNGAKVIGVYRFVIDGAMILTLAGLLWTVSGWKTDMENITKTNSNNNIALGARVTSVEEELKLIQKTSLSNPVISREADARLSVLETAVTVQFNSIDQRLTRIENKM